MENAIEVQGLTKRYPGFTLDHVSFQVPSGSVVGFIGENGAGKSTTIKAILELIRKDEGKIQVLGKEDGASLCEVKEEIGVVFDESCFPDNLRITDINRILKCSYRRWEEDTFLSYCRKFGLPEKKTVKTFSRGMKMKLSIAAALSHHTRLLIMDEATSGLDPVSRDEILDIFREFIQDESHTVFISTHITSDIEKIADYILLIHKGRIVFMEEKDTLLYEYGILRCTPEQAAGIDEKLIAGIRRGRFETEVLVRDISRFQDGSFVTDKASLEDILLFTVKKQAEREE